MNRIRERFALALDDEAIQFPKKCGECLASARRGENERMLTARDRGPSVALWWTGRAERVAEPRSDDRMKALQMTKRSPTER